VLADLSVLYQYLEVARLVPRLLLDGEARSDVLARHRAAWIVDSGELGERD